MRSFFTVFTILISAILSSALVLRHNGPQSDCECPSSDYYGHPLVSSKVDNGDICCYYEDNTKYCSYDEKTGFLVGNYDDGKCPYQATCKQSTQLCWRCPYQDNFSRPLGTYKTDNGNVCCYYEDNSKYCSYDEKTGALVGDNDNGYCPQWAMEWCS